MLRVAGRSDAGLTGGHMDGNAVEADLALDGWAKLPNVEGQGSPSRQGGWSGFVCSQWEGPWEGDGVMRTTSCALWKQPAKGLCVKQHESEWTEAVGGHGKKKQAVGASGPFKGLCITGHSFTLHKRHTHSVVWGSVGCSGSHEPICFIQLPGFANAHFWALTPCCWSQPSWESPGEMCHRGWVLNGIQEGWTGLQ